MFVTPLGDCSTGQWRLVETTPSGRWSCRLEKPCSDSFAKRIAARDSRPQPEAYSEAEGDLGHLSVSRTEGGSEVSCAKIKSANWAAPAYSNWTMHHIHDERHVQLVAEPFLASAHPACGSSPTPKKHIPVLVVPWQGSNGLIDLDTCATRTNIFLVVYLMNRKKVLENK